MRRFDGGGALALLLGESHTVFLQRWLTRTVSLLSIFDGLFSAAQTLGSGFAQGAQNIRFGLCSGDEIVCFLKRMLLSDTSNSRVNILRS